MKNSFLLVKDIIYDYNCRFTKHEYSLIWFNRPNFRLSFFRFLMFLLHVARSILVFCFLVTFVGLATECVSDAVDISAHLMSSSLLEYKKKL